MIKKNDERIGIVCSIGANGEGIVKDDNCVIFVPFAILGEKIKYRALKVTKKCVYAKLLEVITPSADRVKASCPVFGKCGGCQLQHINYSKQLKVKAENIARCFSKIAGLTVNVDEAVVGESAYRYRNKLQLPVVYNGYETIIGFYAEGTHRVVPIDDCPINAVWSKNLIKAFKQYFTEYNVLGYNELDGSGEIREITAKELNSQLIITVVSTTDRLRGVERLIQILNENLVQEFSLYLNVNSKRSNVVYGDKFILLYGKPEYSGEMHGIKYKMGVRSFMQVNPSVCAKLYDVVRKEACVGKDNVVIDAYSGAGLMTALLAQDAKRAIGIEIVPEAVEIANQLAIENGLSQKITNYLGKCEEIMPGIIDVERKKKSSITVVLDPPRKGCDLAVINAVRESFAEKIIYVSCNPSTLARDVGLIVGTLIYDNGQIVKAENSTHLYAINSVTPYDMFAQTKHIETLVCLTLNNKNK